MNKAARHNARRQTDMIIEPRSLITSISRFRFHGFRCSIRSVCVCTCVLFRASTPIYLFTCMYITCSCKHVVYAKSSSFNGEKELCLRRRSHKFSLFFKRTVIFIVHICRHDTMATLGSARGCTNWYTPVDSEETCAEKDRGKRKREREGGRRKERKKRRNPFHSRREKKKTVARDSRFIHGQVYGAKKDFSFEM